MLNLLYPLDGFMDVIVDESVVQMKGSLDVWLVNCGKDQGGI